MTRGFYHSSRCLKLTFLLVLMITALELVMEKSPPWGTSGAIRCAIRQLQELWVGLGMHQCRTELEKNQQDCVLEQPQNSNPLQGHNNSFLLLPELTLHYFSSILCLWLQCIWSSSHQTLETVFCLSSVLDPEHSSVDLQVTLQLGSLQSAGRLPLHRWYTTWSSLRKWCKW